MKLPDLVELERAAAIVHRHMSPTPQFHWPLLDQLLAGQVWVKQENYTPLGAFKVRGGLVYFDWLSRQGDIAGVIAATRGNHGQSVAFAAAHYGIEATIVVPYGNSREKNQSMRALGAQLIEYGEDFQAAREYALQLAQQRKLHLVSSFHPLLVAGVGSYALEFLRAVGELDIVYVPIGLGSGICGMMAARDALALNTEIVGVTSAHAQAYARSFVAGQPVDAEATTRLADGMACRTVESEALELMLSGVSRIVQVTDSEIAGAMRHVFECTHSVAEGAGAGALAAACQEVAVNRGKKIGLVISGGNVDQDVFAEVLSA